MTSFCDLFGRFTIFGYLQLRCKQEFLGGGGGRGGAKAKPDDSPVTDPRISKGEGAISSSHTCANIHKVLWRVRRNISLKKSDTRQKAVILHIFISVKPLTGKIVLEGGWTEKMISQ